MLRLIETVMCYINVKVIISSDLTEPRITPPLASPIRPREPELTVLLSLR